MLIYTLYTMKNIKVILMEKISSNAFMSKYIHYTLYSVLIQ